MRTGGSPRALLRDGYVGGATSDVVAAVGVRMEVRWVTGDRVGCARPSNQHSGERGATHPEVRAAWGPDAHALRRRATLWGERLGGGRYAHTRSPAGVSKPWVASRERCVGDLMHTS